MKTLKSLALKPKREAYVRAHVQHGLAHQIRMLREHRGWTQAELADKCGMRQPRISALEDPDFENVEISTLQRLAFAFDVALSVRFVPFSEIAQRASNLDSSDFNVKDYATDTLVEQKPQLAPIWNMTFGTTVLPQHDDNYFSDFNLWLELGAKDDIRFNLATLSKEITATVHH